MPAVEEKEYKIEFLQIYLSKPTITESDGETSILFPKEARLRKPHVKPLSSKDHAPYGLLGCIWSSLGAPVLHQMLGAMALLVHGCWLAEASFPCRLWAQTYYNITAQRQ